MGDRTPAQGQLIASGGGSDHRWPRSFYSTASAGCGRRCTRPRTGCATGGTRCTPRPVRGTYGGHRRGGHGAQGGDRPGRAAEAGRRRRGARSPTAGWSTRASRSAARSRRTWRWPTRRRAGCSCCTAPRTSPTTRATDELPVQLHVADPDPFEPHDWLNAWYLRMGRAGADVEVFRYPGAGHLYTDPRLPDYDEEAAEADLAGRAGLPRDGEPAVAGFPRGPAPWPVVARGPRRDSRCPPLSAPALRPLDPLGAREGAVGAADQAVGRVRVGLVGDGVVVHLRALGGHVQHAVAVGVQVEPLHVAVGGPEQRPRRPARRCRRHVQEVVEVVGGHRGDHELGGRRRRQRVGRGLHRDVVGPRHVDVAGEEDGVADGLVAQVGEQLAPVGGVAVPLVGVDRRPSFGQPEQLGERAEQPAGSEPKATGEIITELPTSCQRGVGGGQPVLQPVQLRAAGDRAVRVVDVAVADAPAASGRCAGRAGTDRPACRSAAGGRWCPRWRGGPASTRSTPAGRRPRGRRVALGARRVVLGAAGPGVVGDLVVVPDRDHRVRGVQRLQVGVGLVLAVPDAVVGERDDLVRRAVRADDVLAPAYSPVPYS